MTKLGTASLERYQRIAPVYDLLDLPFEFGRYRRIRPLLFADLSGHLLDAGVGTGRNIAYHPPGATVIGIDTSPAMLARARRRLARSPAAVEPGQVELRQMDVSRLEFPSGAFDAAVATFLFCVLAEELQVPALRELARVVRPGGTIRLLEYGRPRAPRRRAIAKLREPWMAWAYGAGFDRGTEAHIPEAGLELLEARFVADELIKLMTARVRG